MASGFRDCEASEDEEYVAERAPQVLGAVALDLDAALGEQLDLGSLGLGLGLGLGQGQ